MFQYRREVWKITEWKDDSIYKTVKVCDIWIEVKPRTTEEENQIARENDGDILASTHDYRNIQPTE